MKRPTYLLLVLFTTLLSHAVADVVAGPQGGRLLATDPHPVEFLVTPDRHAELIFYTADQTPTGAGETQVSLITEPASGRTTLDLAPTAHGFRSVMPLPEATPYRVVVQVRTAPGAPPRNFRIDLNLQTCGECQRAEYACTCEGH